MLEWLQNTDLAVFIQISRWGYPVVLASHAVGMAVLAGVVLMICLRVLGLAPAIPISGLRIMLQLAFLGFLINLISGTLLFIADAAVFYESNPFRVKILLLVTNALLLVALWRRLFGDLNATATAISSPSTRLVAGISVLTWIGTIVAGRLIAYVDVSIPGF